MNLYPTHPELPDAAQLTRNIAANDALRTFLRDGTNAGEAIVCRAPGRLDVMGGVADYSGSLVAEATVAEAALVALSPRTDDLLRVWSLDAAGEGWTAQASFALSSFYEQGTPLPFDAVRSRLTADPPLRWAAYVLGCWHVLLAEGAVRAFPHGANVVLTSRVPLGAGVSSSAAIEVAAMQAVSVCYGLNLDGTTVARLSQMVENRVVGAPCGIMDQMASALGERNSLLLIRCQPHDVLGTQGWPVGVRLFGINSSVKHSVGGGAYGRARVAAFMGRKLLGVDYLADTNYDAARLASLPEAVTGAEFLAAHGETGDTVTRIDPRETYPVRGAALHAFMENRRVEQFTTLLPDASAHLSTLGRLMFDAHESYNSIGLGSPETDLLVQMARDAGPERGIYGAKITGGGSGGTVAFLAFGDAAEEAVRGIASRYGVQTGLTPHVMEAGLSPGALAFGHRRVRL